VAFGITFAATDWFDRADHHAVRELVEPHGKLYVVIVLVEAQRGPA
jgi:hypothetical protein